jgi:hypothetical protein
MLQPALRVKKLCHGVRATAVFRAHDQLPEVGRWFVVWQLAASYSGTDAVGNQTRGTWSPVGSQSGETQALW